MFSPEQHILGARVDAVQIVKSLDDIGLRELVGDEIDTLEARGRGYINDESKNSIEYVRLAVTMDKLESHYVSVVLAKSVKRDNWIKVYRGIAIGNSEEKPEEDEEFLIVGVTAQEVVVGLNKNMSTFRDWLVDHLNTYHITAQLKDIKYYHLTTYL